MDRLSGRSGWVTVLGYLSAGVVIVTVFIYLTFPWNKLSLWIQGEMEKALGVELSVGESEFNFPFGLEWKDVTLTRYTGSAPAQISVERFTMEWPILAILGRRLEIDISTRTFDGDFQGRLVTQNTGKEIKYRLTGSGGDFDLGRLALFLNVPIGTFKGRLQIKGIEHEWVNQNWWVGQGAATLEAYDVGVPEYGVAVSQISGKLALKSGMANLKDVSAQGKGIDFIGSGSLLLKPRFTDSLLDFNSRLTLDNPSGSLSMLSALSSPGGSMNLSFRGPLKRPKMYIDGQELPVIGFGLKGLDSRLIGKSPVVGQAYLFERVHG